MRSTRGERRSGTRFAVLALSIVLLWSPSAFAQAAPAKNTVALVGFDALGMDAERVKRLETLFLKELERLSQAPVPSRFALSKLSKRLRRCDGGNKCLAAIGRALQVSSVVSGNVAALGDSYILTIKAVASATGQEIRRVESDPLRGEPDELIESIRVAAYRLLAPEKLLGSIAVLADRSGAIVELDSKVIGKTPLARPIKGVSLGMHKLVVNAGDFGSFSSEVMVRFQKTTQVTVKLVDLSIKKDPGETTSIIISKPDEWYESTWFITSTVVGVAVAGAILGYLLVQQDTINCNAEGTPCSESL